MRRESLTIETCSHHDKKFRVEIDIEHFEEYTSEEEVYKDVWSVEQGSVSGSDSYTGVSRKITLQK